MGVQLDLLSWRPQPVDQGPKRRAVRRPKAPKPVEVPAVPTPVHARESSAFCAAAHAWFHRPKIGA